MVNRVHLLSDEERVYSGSLGMALIPGKGWKNVTRDSRPGRPVIQLLGFPELRPGALIKTSREER